MQAGTLVAAAVGKDSADPLNRQPPTVPRAPKPLVQVNLEKPVQVNFEKPDKPWRKDVPSSEFFVSGLETGRFGLREKESRGGSSRSRRRRGGGRSRRNSRRQKQ